MKSRKKVHRFKSKVLEIKQLTHDVKHIVISIPDDFDFYAGQFISFIMKIKGREVRRPYSIASKPSLNSLEVCIKILPDGLATPIIDKFKVGEELDVLGPMGAFTVQQQSLNKPITFISTGTGIGPFRSIIQDLLENNFQNPILLLTGYRVKGDCLYEDELKKLENKYKNFSYKRILSREGEKGHVQVLIEENFNEGADYYICGLKEMINSVKDLLIKKGVPKENIFFEKYD